MNNTTSSRPPDGNRRNYKVGRVLEEYDLPELDANLEGMWLDGTSERSFSLRELSEYINKRLLQTAMEWAGIDPIDGETDETYRLLKSSDIDEDARRKAIHRLEREGVDVEQLNQDFVTHQAVHTYLTEFRNVERDSRHSNATNTVERLQGELSSVTAETLESVRDDGEIVLGNFDLEIVVQVRCVDCGETVTLDQLFHDGGCHCRHRSD